MPEIDSRDPVVARIRAALAAHDERLRLGLRALLADLDFPPHPRFRRAPAPDVDPDTDALLGILIEYDFGTFEPRAYGLSPAGGFKFGTRRLLATYDSDALDEDDACEHEALPELVEAWVRDAWRDVRDVAPNVRGFVSIHDSGGGTDLDTGEDHFSLEDIGLRPR